MLIGSCELMFLYFPMDDRILDTLMMSEKDKYQAFTFKGILAYLKGATKWEGGGRGASCFTPTKNGGGKSISHAEWGLR